MSPGDPGYDYDHDDDYESELRNGSAITKLFLYGKISLADNATVMKETTNIQVMIA
jgi:hypothetical protein